MKRLRGIEIDMRCVCVCVCVRAHTSMFLGNQFGVLNIPARRCLLYRHRENTFSHNALIHNIQNVSSTCRNIDGEDTDSVCPASYRGFHNPPDSKSITKKQQMIHLFESRHRCGSRISRGERQLPRGLRLPIILQNLCRKKNA